MQDRIDSAYVKVPDRAPKENRGHTKRKPGDDLDITTDGDRIVMTPSTLDLDLCRVLPPPKRASQRSMNSMMRLAGTRFEIKNRARAFAKVTVPPSG